MSTNTGSAPERAQRHAGGHHEPGAPVLPLPGMSEPPDAPRKPRRWIVVVLLAVALLAGFGIGAASGGQGSTVAAQKHTISSLQHTLAGARADVATSRQYAQQQQSAAQQAQQQAAHATQRAQAKVRSQYQARLSEVAAMRRTLRRELTIVAQSTISADGVYVVGQDIPPGTYHTSGGGQCYYATLISSTNTNDVNNISDNNNFTGPSTVDLAGMHAFQISGGCTWHKIG